MLAKTGLEVDIENAPSGPKGGKKVDQKVDQKGAPKHRSVTMAAAAVKNRFGQAMNAIAAGRHVEITRYDRIEAVMVPVDDYRKLTRAGEMVLDVLQDEFDALYERMQSDESRDAVEAAFSSSPEALAEAARTI